MNYCQNLFEKRGEQLERILLIDGDTGRQFTYSQVQEAVLKVSHFLKSRGFKKGDVIAMHIYNSVEAVICHMAVQYAGLISCMLDPLLKINALDYYIEDAGVKFLITHGGLTREEVDSVPVMKTPEITELIENIEAETDSDEMAAYGPRELSSIFYTSGTTSMPKGVMLAPENFYNHVEIFRDGCYQYEPEDCLICFVPFSHGFGSKSLMLPCIKDGASMVIMRSFHPKKVAQFIEEYGVSHIFGVPSHYQQLLKATQYLPQLKKLKRAFTAAALLIQDTAREWFESVGIYLDEGFGLIETSTGVAFRTEAFPATTGEVGKNNPKLIDLEILDDNLNTLPSGERGEVAIRGRSVMLGYLNKPEENEKALRDGWFITGDVGYKNSEGSLVLTGRSKDIINIAGLKVCPFEVESVLNEIPEVVESTVLGKQDSTYGEIVTAYIIRGKGENISERDIIKYAGTRLPSFQVPRIITFLDEFPRNNMGKIDKKVLKMKLGA